LNRLNSKQDPSKGNDDSFIMSWAPGKLEAAFCSVTNHYRNPTPLPAQGYEFVLRQRNRTRKSMPRPSGKERMNRYNTLGIHDTILLSLTGSTLVFLPRLFDAAIEKQHLTLMFCGRRHKEN